MERFTEDLLFIVFVLLIAAILSYLIAYFIYRGKIKDLEFKIDSLKKQNDNLEKNNATLQQKNKKLTDETSALKADKLKVEQELEECKNTNQNNTSTPEKANENLEIKAAEKELEHGVKIDDLTVIDGIGPKIQNLLRIQGIDTWKKLSESKKEILEQILHDGGERFRLHDPTSWPAQAKLASLGKWDDLKTMQDDLFGGKIV